MATTEVTETNASCKIHDENSKYAGVRFGDLVVHEYLQILGDNPAVSEGPPLTIGWQPISSTKMDIDLYEHVREPQRRKEGDLRVPRKERDVHLLSIGYNFSEILIAINEANKIRGEREASFQNQKWDGFSVVVEKATSKMKKLMGTTYKQEQPGKASKKNISMNAPSA